MKSGSRENTLRRKNSRNSKMGGPYLGPLVSKELDHVLYFLALHSSSESCVVYTILSIFLVKFQEASREAKKK